MVAYSEFMPQVMEYAIDSAADVEISLAGNEITKLSEDIFFDKLYVTSPNQAFEETLYRRMLSSTQLTCVAAFRGSGKTSALHHTAGRLSREQGRVIVPVIIDVKRLYDNGAFSPLTDQPTPEIVGSAYHIFKTEIRKVIQVRLLSGFDHTVDMVAWTLAGAPDESDDFSDVLVSGLVDISDRAIAATHAVGMNRRERMAAIADMLRDAHSFTSFHHEVAQHVTPAHVVRASMTIRGLKRVVLIFDNIDRIPTPYQIKFLEVVNDLHNALAGTCGTVVAIRREALQSIAPRPNEKGDPIDIIAPNNVTYSFLLFPETRGDHVREILQRRHDFCIQLYKETADDNELQKVENLHVNLLDEFVRDSIHALANGSIRALAKIYTGFFRFLTWAESDALRRGGRIVADEGHFQTLFFLFLRDNAREYGLVFHEEVRMDVDAIAADRVEQLATLPYLLLTGLFNLSNEMRDAAGPERDVMLYQLMERITALGFTTQDIRTTLAQMHAAPGDPPAAIEFADADPDLVTVALDSPLRLRLTPRGHVLVAQLLHRVGYMWGSAYESHRRTAAPTTSPASYYSLSWKDRMHIFFEYLRVLALQHIRLLALVRQLRGSYGREAIQVYRRHFGVDGMFHVQRLLASAAAFYGPGQDVNPFPTLLRAYNGLVDDLVRGVEYSKLPTESLLQPFEYYAV